MLEFAGNKWTNWLKCRYRLAQEDAEDIVQEALVDLLQFLQYRDIDPEPAEVEGITNLPIFHTILSRRAVDHLRQQQRDQKAKAQYTLLYQSHETQQPIWFDYLAACEVQSRMDPFWRQVLKWRIDGVSWGEISKRVDKPLSTLSSGLERHLERVCACLGYTRQVGTCLCVKSTGSRDINNGCVKLSHPSENNASEVAYDETAQDALDQHDSFVISQPEFSARYSCLRQRKEVNEGGG